MNRVFILILLFFITPICSAEVITDEIADKLPKYLWQKPAYKDYNFESTVKLPVKMRILEEVHCENDIYEGEELKFRVLNDVYHNSDLRIRQNSIVTARVKTIITPGMNGIPASIILDEFKIDGVNKGQFVNSIEVFGQDRSLLVFPLKWALTILPPTGSLTNFIRGGHAKIKPKKTITLYYYPEWL